MNRVQVEHQIIFIFKIKIVTYKQTYSLFRVCFALNYIFRPFASLKDNVELSYCTKPHRIYE